jgi:CubicO group peptidase (beta-lactamase class C family)
MSGSAGFDRDRLGRLDRHFARYVDDGRLPGWQLAVTRHGNLVHSSAYGWRDLEAKAPVAEDTLWRIYSMTKPIVSVAAMTLWEEGVFELDDPISRWIPSFEDVRVYASGSANDVVTLPAAEPIRVRHLLTHTSGLTAGWMNTTTVDAVYRQAGYAIGAPAGTTLESMCDDLAGLPLLFQPGSAWGYGLSTDVLGRLVELWTGEGLAAAVASRVTAPLGMVDTVWWADPERAGRLAALYVPDAATGRAVRMDAIGDAALTPPQIHSGGGGLLSTLADYVRFTRMLAGRGELEGVRILAPSTLRLMTTNHLGADLATLLTGGFHGAVLDGVGFGLGFAVVLDPAKAHSVASPGEFYWGGAASTVFWVDPSREVTAVFMTQVMPFRDSQLVPADAYPIRTQLRQLVYSALVG